MPFLHFDMEQIILVESKELMILEQRFIRNIPSLSEKEQAGLAGKRAAVIGCGGLGGYIVEILARVGLGGITVADGDVFDESNLNRQCLALPENLGQNKARAAEARIKAIDEKIDVRCFEEFFSGKNADAILKDADIVLDALDSVPVRLLLEDKCGEKGLHLVHGAVELWQAQVCMVSPGSGMLHRLYGEAKTGPAGSVTAPAAAMCAAMQCSQALQFLCGKACGLENKLFLADLQTMDFEKISL